MRAIDSCGRQTAKVRKKSRRGTFVKVAYLPGPHRPDNRGHGPLLQVVLYTAPLPKTGRAIVG
jgi:hypothetical protein